MTTKIFVDGEAGTTGLQVRELLAQRRDLTVLEIDPENRKNREERKRLLNESDVAILCLPDEAAEESVQLIENDTTKVIDTSTAHRVNDDWLYGFPEMDQKQPQQISEARRVSNPGCWPQGGIATLRPLVNAGLIPSNFPVTIHGITGYSGGGKSMIEAYSQPTIQANKYSLYGLSLEHKHLPEIQKYAKLSFRPLFTPAIGNFSQGMVVVVCLQLETLPTTIPSIAQIHSAIADHYSAIPGGFVDVASLNESGEINPELHNGSNRMRLHVCGSDSYGQAILVAVYDNLGKGASGAAVQNLNLMLGL